VAILVDDARWPFRGEQWAHLVSDHSYDELHDFAQRLGLRRLSFQGDHYDIPAPVRAAALAQGAVAIPGRELVTRLRAAGLRRPRSGNPWTRLVQYPPPGRLTAALMTDVGAALDRAAVPALAAARLHRALHRVALGAPRLAGWGLAVLVRRGEAAVSVDVVRADLAEPAAITQSGDVDACYCIRRDDAYSVELMVRLT